MKTTLLLTLILAIITPCFSQSPKKSETVKLNGVDTYYEVYGDGEPLFLLHGLTQTHETWDLWIDSLSHHYKLIVPDLRGHGRSSTPKEKINYRVMAQDVYALMDEFGINKFKAEGISMGALILLHLATMDTTRLEAMILIGGATYFDEQFREFVKDWSFETTTGDWLETLRKIHMGGDEQIEWIANQFQNFFLQGNCNDKPCIIKSKI